MPTSHPRQLDLHSLLRRSADEARPWRSLEELADLPEFRDYVEEEFPHGALRWDEPVERRTFLKLMGAALGLAGTVACHPPQDAEEIIPYVEQPEMLVPGEPLFFATALRHYGFAMPVLAKTHEGRPQKIEGNPDHPMSFGATTPQAQAEVLSLYDPDRSRTVRHRGSPRGRHDAFAALMQARQRAAKNRGAGLRILTGTVTSPFLAHQIQQILNDLPEARWHAWEPASPGNQTRAAIAEFGRNLSPHLHLKEASVIISFDHDVMAEGPAQLHNARSVADLRRVRTNDAAMGRMLVAEPSPSLTGTMATERVPATYRQMSQMARALLEERPTDDLPAELALWTKKARMMLQQSGANALVTAGPHAPPELHRAAWRLAERAGGLGTLLYFTEPIAASPPGGIRALQALVREMNDGDVEQLLILGGDPANTAPSDVPFAEAMEQVPFTVHLHRYVNATSKAATWHLPATHELEEWSDARAADGRVSIIQPVIAPLFGGISAHEMLAAFAGGNAAPSPLQMLHAFWAKRLEASDFERLWRASLHDGWINRTEESAVPVRLSAHPIAWPAADSEALHVHFRPDPTVGDGRWANNAWLQELPKPFSKVTWDNCALISVGRAAAMGVHQGDFLRLMNAGNHIQVPAFILPGQHNDIITVHTGYGSDSVPGRIAERAGFDTKDVRTADAFYRIPEPEVEATDDAYDLATTQNHHAMEERDPVKRASLAAIQEGSAHLDGHHPDADLLRPYPEMSDRYQWAMVIDLNVCHGCNACVVACQAENNIPVVGREEVRRGREMHWIRIDSYFAGSAENPEILQQPVPCMHCEKAPCEVVCPVAATTHSNEGLNQMTYNRCVGTRYCSNNCPYKVRRFNYYDYAQDAPEPTQVQRNPNVSVRSRGVMEKCTYCAQRINRARQQAKITDQPIRDEQVVPACAQACPTRAIVFGNLLNEDGAIPPLREQPHHYSLLAELNTKPRTTYLARVARDGEENGHGH